MLCPVCDVELKAMERQGIEIDFCPKCRGVWLDRGELEKLIEREATQTVPYQAAPAPVAAPGYPVPAYPPNAYAQPPVPAYRGYDDDDDDDYHKKSYNKQGRRRGFLGDMFDFD